MERLRATVRLDLPAAEIERLLPKYVDQYRLGESRALMPLAVPLSEFGIPGDLSLARSVSVAVERRRDEQNLNDEFGVQWKAEGSRLFPSFDGRLIVCKETPTSSYIELDGRYDPPFGDAGDAFDIAVGHTIAQTTARSFLESIRTGLMNLVSHLGEQPARIVPGVAPDAAETADEIC